MNLGNREIIDESGTERFIQSFNAHQTKSGWECEVVFANDLTTELSERGTSVVRLLNAIDGVESFPEQPTAEGEYIIYLLDGTDSQTFRQNLAQKIREILREEALPMAA